MAASDLRKFFFYQKFLWGPQNFSDLQSFIFGTMQGIAEGAFGASVLSGLRVTPSSLMTLNVASGVAVSASGKLMVVPSSTPQTLTAPSVNPKKSLIVLRPNLVQTDFFPQPTAPNVQVPLYERQQYTMVVLDGTESATPVYPATQADDVILMGLSLTVGMTTITRANFDLQIVSRPARRKIKVAQKTANYTAQESDDVIEANFGAASGVVQLPPAGDVEGMAVTIIKTDSSVNQVAVSGNGAETISGQNVITLDAQWDKVTVYSNAQAWRLI